MQNKLLITCCIHGDELLGKKIFDNYPNGKSEHWNYKSIIANPTAMFANKRFVDTDLNRSFPGDKNSINLEERIASNLLKEYTKFNNIVDIHQTTAIMPNIAFVRTRTEITDKICKSIGMSIIIEDCQDGGFGGEKCTITDYFNNAVCLEYSRKNNIEEEFAEARIDLDNILNNTIVNPTPTYYYISASLNKNIVKEQLSNLKLLTPVQKNLYNLEADKDYMPIFIGEEAYKDTYCHLITKL